MSNRILAASFVLALALIFFGCNNGGGSGDDSGTSVVYGGQTYKTVVIGTQTWFAENLNYSVEGSRCYGEGGLVYGIEAYEFIAISPAEVQANCARYGRLYDWATAMNLPSNCNSTSCAGMISAKHRGVCPVGWHIPSNAEWSILINYVDGIGGSIMRDSPTAGRYLKAKSGWDDIYSELSGKIFGNGQDTYGFAALPGGNGYPDDYSSWYAGRFIDVGYFGIWWSATEYHTADYDYAYYLDMSSLNESASVDYSNKTPLQSVRCVKD